MHVAFNNYRLDTRLFRLLRGDEPCKLEPQVFNLLAYLIQHRDRVISRDELLEQLWRGKVVSESALSSCIKAARIAIGDNGNDQHSLLTLHGRGYRFIAHAQELEPPSPAPAAEAPATDTPPARRTSLAVMPFADISAASGTQGGIADALVQDIITRLAQLRSLLVIAQGSVFALHEQQINPVTAGQLLKVDYLVSGTLRRIGPRLIVTAELVETREAAIVWAEAFDQPVGDALNLLDDIGNKIVAAIAGEIESAERNRALLKPPNSLDAWAAHHRGLWHMYRFNADDNHKAQGFFEMATRLDPTFSRAYAGLSFTYFQSAFQGWGEPTTAIERAYSYANLSLSTDVRNPAAHWAMGRALWLRNQDEQALEALTQATQLSPSFALAHYTLAFVHAQTGTPHTAISAADYAQQLSPYDPLLFGILGARAIALVRLEDFDAAAHWAARASTAPNAHTHILAISAFSAALAGQLETAHQYAEAIHHRVPDYSIQHFLTAFKFDTPAATLFHHGAERIGMG